MWVDYLRCMKRLFEVHETRCMKCELHDRVRKHLIWCTKIPVPRFLFLEALSMASVFSENSTVLPYFFHLKSFLWKVLLKIKFRKKSVHQILGYISFCSEIRVWLSHYFAWTPKIIKFNRWSCSKSLIYCLNNFLREKCHKKWIQEC